MTNDNTHTPDGAGETTPPLSLVARALVAAATEAVHVPLTVLLVSPAGAEVAHSWWDADDGGQVSSCRVASAATVVATRHLLLEHPGGGEPCECADMVKRLTAELEIEGGS